MKSYRIPTSLLALVIVSSSSALPVPEAESAQGNATLTQMALPDNYLVVQSKDDILPNPVITVEENCTAFNGYKADDTQRVSRPAMQNSNNTVVYLNSFPVKGSYSLAMTDTDCHHGAGVFDPEGANSTLTDALLFERDFLKRKKRLSKDVPDKMVAYYTPSDSSLIAEVIPDLTPSNFDLMSATPVGLMEDNKVIVYSYLGTKDNNVIPECLGSYACNSIDLYEKIDGSWKINHLFYQNHSFDVIKAGDYLVYETDDSDTNRNLTTRTVHVLEPPYTSAKKITSHPGKDFYSFINAFVENGELKLVFTSNENKSCIEVVSASTSEIAQHQCAYYYESLQTNPNVGLDGADTIYLVPNGDGNIGFAASWIDDPIDWPGPYKDQMVLPGKHFSFMSQAFPVLSKFKDADNVVSVSAVQSYTSYKSGSKVRMAIRAPDSEDKIMVPYLLEFTSW